jgi:hypothetical protein
VSPPFSSTEIVFATQEIFRILAQIRILQESAIFYVPNKKAAFMLRPL